MCAIRCLRSSLYRLLAGEKLRVNFVTPLFTSSLHPCHKVSHQVATTQHNYVTCLYSPLTIQQALCPNKDSRRFMIKQTLLIVINGIIHHG